MEEYPPYRPVRLKKRVNILPPAFNDTNIFFFYIPASTFCSWYAKTYRPWGARLNPATTAETYRTPISPPLRGNRVKPGGKPLGDCEGPDQTFPT